MEIEEIKKRRNELEKEIYNLLYHFEEDTQTLVEDVDLTRIERMTRHSPLFNVRLNLRL